MPETPLNALASQPTGRRRCFDARDHVRHVECCRTIWANKFSELRLPAGVRATWNWPQDPEETAAELKPHLDGVVVSGDHSEDIGKDLCSPYAGPGQLRPAAGAVT
jgi:hypothetical protein